MRRSSIYIIAALIVLLASCKKPESTPTGTLKIQYQPTFGTSSLMLNTTYSMPSGEYINFTSAGIYLSHFILTKTDNSQVVIPDSVELLFYNNSPITFTLSAPVASYKSVAFSIGLDSTQNKISPSSGSSDSAFISNLLYWDDVRLHLFIQLQGYSGTSPSLGGVFFYHEGNDSINMYRTTSVTHSFAIAVNQTTSLTLNADLQKVFYGPGSIDVVADPGTHTRDHPQTATTVADAFAQIFSIQ